MPSASRAQASARSSGTPSARNIGGDPLRRQRLEAHQLAAGDHRLDHPAQRVGEQDQVHERRRLLQRLQEPIGHLVVHGVHALEHEHAPGGLEGGAGGGGHHRLGHVLDPHHVRAGGPHPGEVGMGAVLDPQPHRVRILRALGQQLGGERPGHGPLAGAGGPVEQVRVRGAVREGAGEHDPRLRVVLGTGQPSDGAHASAPLRSASTSASTSACTSSGTRVGVDPAPAPRVELDQPLVGGTHRLLERIPFLLEAVALPRPRSRRGRVDLQEKGEIGTQRTGGEAVDVGHVLDPQPAGAALVGEGGVEEAVGDHHAALGQRGEDHLAHQLGPGGGEQQCLGLGGQRDGGVLQDGAHQLPGLGAAGLADTHGVIAQRAGQQLGLGGLAGAVDSLEGDEQAAHRAATLAAPAGGASSHYDGAPMRALVTGGAGFIGSNLVDALLARGDEVTVLDDLSTGHRENLDGADRAELVEGDIRDGAGVADLVARTEPEVIFHLAAQIDVRKSVADPAFDARTNVEGTINVLQAAQAAGVPRVVNTSSGGAIYGEGRTIPAPEDHPVAPEAPYGLSKFCAEQYCEIFNRLHGLSTVSLRYGNVYGPRQDPLGEAGVIAIFCGKLLEGAPATIFGDGRQTRDYVYVGDVVEANLLAAESDGDRPVQRRARARGERGRPGRGAAAAGPPERRARAGAARRGDAHRPRHLARA